MKEQEHLDKYYSRYDEDGRLTSNHGQVEFLTTIRYIEKHLQPNMRILEVGAGTGRYSLYFAHKGYEVNSIELIEHNIDIFKKQINDRDNITIEQGNALDLSRFEDNTFDVTLVLGPLYHLFEEDDKRKAISEALRVTKKKGILIIAYLTHDSVIVSWGLLGGKFAEGVKQNMFTKDYKCISSPEMIFEMFHVKDFNQLMSNFKLKHLHTVATDGIVQSFRTQIDSMDEEVFNEWMKYHYTTCEREDLVGYSNHVVYIGRKD